MSVFFSSAERTKADQQFRGLLVLLKSQPMVGQEDEDHPGVFEYILPRVPFTVMYRIKGEAIEIMRLLKGFWLNR